MRIIEQSCIGKRTDAACEDGVRVTADYAAVVDGSTSKTRKPTGRSGITSGQKAMRTVLSALSSLPAEATMERAVSHLTEALRRATPDLQSLPAEERPTCSAAIYSRKRREVWLIGDCQCRFGGQTYTHPKQVDTVLTQIRCDVVRHFLKSGYKVEDLLCDDRGRAFILDVLREQTHFQNDPNTWNPYRYPVLDGTCVDLACVPTWTVAESPFVILASDGYPVLHDSLAETEAELYRLLQEDPLCITANPATKCLVCGNRSFDDRTYLKIDTTA